ncbi:glycoprotease family-domain-containing protein [Microdochium bolleyi]|uniref:N(6)-L-threonylcarbamoyladenine synthase n=1 Tax=Microdochium bolleyi TaxID=196109 RepID=A0A136IMB4_9PEZI|nr:glycoprotease family-domain-containing protein [Microdochium bolleyi]
MAPLLKRALKALPADEGVGSTGGGGIVWAAGKARRKPDFVTVTRGPGMLSNLTVGLMTAKSLAVAWDVPLLAVHHMEAHALTPRLVHALEQGKLASPATETASSSSSSASSADEDGKSDTDDEKMTKKQENDTGAPGRTEFPFLSLLVSGGHSLLVHSRGLNDHSILAEAHNIAIGDLLDKCARVILPESYIAAAPDVMYGRLLEEFAFPTSAGSPKGWDAAEIVDQGYEYAPPRTKLDEKRTYRSQARGWSLTPPLHESAAMRFDFSGLNGRVHAIMRGDPSALPPRGGGGGGEDVGVNINAHPLSVRNRRELARVTMRIAFEHLASRLLMALKKLAPKVQEKEEGPQLRAIKTVVVSGGVASNKYLRHILRAMLDARGFAGVEIVCPPVHLCTDNAAMIAWAGMEMYEAGWRSELDVRPIKKWPLDPGGEGEGGVLGVPGWYSEKQPVGE